LRTGYAVHSEQAILEAYTMSLEQGQQWKL